MADLLQVSGGVVNTGNLSETWAAAANFMPTTDRNDSSVYGWNSTTAIATLPASGLADGYLIVFAYEFADDGARFNPQAQITQQTGTGNFVGEPSGGFLRDASEDRAYVRCFGFVDSPSASATFRAEVKADADDVDAADGTIQSYLEVIPLYYSNHGIYSSTSAALYGGTTPSQVTGFTAINESDTNAIELVSNVVTVKTDNKRYLTLAGQFFEGRGGRTQRWHGLEIDGAQENAAKAYSYYRNTSNDESGDLFTWLIDRVTTDITIEQTCYRGDGVTNGDGGADSDGSTPSAGEHALVVLELNDDCEVFRSENTADSSDLSASPTALDVVTVAGLAFNDSASWTRHDDQEINAVVAMDGLFGANISAASNNVTTGSRWTAYAEFTVGGTTQAPTIAGDYLRNNQSSIDTFGWSANLLSALALTAGQDVGVTVTERAGTENGGNAISPTGWSGFWGINLDTMEAAGSDTTINATHDSLTLTTYPVTLQPNVYLNTSETLTGATEMTVTSYNLAGTSITFDDPAGAPTGSLSLGVQNMASGEVGWISVTVNTGDTTINATHDALTLTEYAVSTAFDVSIDATHDSLVLTEHGTSIALDVTISATHDALALTEYQVSTTFDVQIDATHDALALTEYATSIVFDVDINATHDALVLTAYPVSLSTDTVISATHDALALTEYATSIVVDVEINATHDALTLTTYQVSLSADTVIEATHDALSLTEYPVSTVYDVAINATHDALTLTTYPVSLGQDVNITATHHALSLTQYQITAQYDVTINATHNALAITEYAVTQQFNVTIAAEHDALVLTTYPTTIVAGLDTLIEATHDALTLTEYVATVFGVQLDQAVQPTGGISKIRRRQRFLIEIDGQFFDAESVQAVQAQLEMVRELAEQSAEQDAITHVDKPIRIKPPRIRVTTSDRKLVESITIRRDLEKTQRIVNDIYRKTADNVRDIRLLASKRAERIRRDEEEAIISLLL